MVSGEEKQRLLTYKALPLETRPLPLRDYATCTGIWSEVRLMQLFSSR